VRGGYQTAFSMAGEYGLDFEVVDNCPKGAKKLVWLVGSQALEVSAELGLFPGYHCLMQELSHTLFV